MAFWRDGINPEPRRAHRWKIRFGTAGDDQNKLKSYYASKVTKPKLSLNTAEHKYLGHTFKFPGNATWDDVKITLVDVDHTARAAIMALYKSGYHPPVDGNDTSTVSKDKALIAVGGVVIEQLTAGGFHSGDPGKKLDSWTLKNAWIKELSFGDLDYEDDKIVTIEMTISYDWATYKDEIGSVWE